MSQLSVDLLETYKVALSHYADMTRQNRFGSLLSFLREGFRRGWITEPLHEKVSKPSASHTQKQPYTDEEVSRFLEAALAMPPAKTGYGSKPATFRLLLDLMLATGMRVSDAICYDPRKAVKSEHFWIYSFFPKKRQKNAPPKLVDVYLEDGLKTAIDEADWFSPSLPFRYSGVPTSRVDEVDVLGRYVWWKMQRIGKVANVDDCRPHRLRDTFAVRALLDGVPLEDVSRLLGHANVGITEKYYAAWTSTRKLRLERVLAAARKGAA
jgi:integrase